MDKYLATLTQVIHIRKNIFDTKIIHTDSWAPLLRMIPAHPIEQGEIDLVPIWNSHPHVLVFLVSGYSVCYRKKNIDPT